MRRKPGILPVVLPDLPKTASSASIISFTPWDVSISHWESRKIDRALTDTYTTFMCIFKTTQLHTSRSHYETSPLAYDDVFLGDFAPGFRGFRR